MYRSFGIFGLSAALLVAAASCSRMQSFELSGRIDGLQVGDTAPFRTCPASGVELRTGLRRRGRGGGCVRLSGRAGARRLLLDDLSSEKRQGRRCGSSGQVDDRDRRRPDHADRYGGGDLLLYSRRAVSTTIPRFPNCCTSRIRSVGFGAVTAKMCVQLSHAATKRRAGGGTNSSIGFMPTIRAPHANVH